MSQSDQSASSVVLRGFDASTFSEIEAFVNSLEERTTERLLRDLPKLATLSSTKVSLVSYVVATRYRRGTAEERLVLKEGVKHALEQAPTAEAHACLSEIAKRLK